MMWGVIYLNGVPCLLPERQVEFWNVNEIVGNFFLSLYRMLTNRQGLSGCLLVYMDLLLLHIVMSFGRNKIVKGLDDQVLGWWGVFLCNQICS